MGYLGVDGIDSAPAIVRLSKVKGLDVIAITDLYSGEFVDKMVKAAEGSPLTVIPGVSLRCKLGACDDVILSCLFPENTTTADINSFLSALKIPLLARGNAQYVTTQSMDEIIQTLEAFSGLAIPTRIDKTPNRLSVLSELVEKYGFRTFDLAYVSSEELFQKRWPKTKFNLFSFSDANALAQIGSRIARVKLADPGFAAIKEMMGRQHVSM
jgi:PHP family Zn ribbon phosphoesterase